MDYRKKSILSIILYVAFLALMSTGILILSDNLVTGIFAIFLSLMILNVSLGIIIPKRKVYDYENRF